MQIIITGKDFKLTPAIKKFVTQKVSKLLKYSKRIMQVKVELDVDKHHHKGDNFRAEIWVTLPKKIIQAGLKGNNLHQVIDTLLPKIEQQLTHYKGKLKDQQKRQSSIRANTSQIDQ